MKRLLLLFLLLFFLSSSLSAQTFTLSDKVFRSGDWYVASRIYFDRGKWDLLPESYPELDSILNFLKANQHISVEVGAHVDSRWNENYSLCLACKRAQVITDYFIVKGIDADRLISRSYNDYVPRVIEADASFMKKGDVITDEYINKLKTEEQKEEAHAMNRRIEIKIIKDEPRYFKLTDTVFNVGDVYISRELIGMREGWTPPPNPTLDSIADFLIKNKQLSIEISLYGDSRPAASYSLLYTTKRAASIVDELVEKGIDKHRLTATGYGCLWPIIPDDEIARLKTEEEKEAAHLTNKRAEIKILKTE